MIPHHTQSWLVADGSTSLLGLVFVSPRQPVCEAVLGGITHIQIVTPQQARGSTESSRIKLCYNRSESSRKVSLPSKKHWEIVGEVCVSWFEFGYVLFEGSEKSQGADL